MKKLFFALPFLLAGCQSERVAFHFQPAPAAVSRAAAPAPAAPMAAPTSQAQALAAPVEGSGAAAPRAARQPAFLARQLAGRARRPATSRRAADAASVSPVAPPVRPGLVGRHVLRRLGRQHATAESGLGGIAFFAIAVVLGLLAGLGALVSLIFGTGFFTGVGFAAAGLVVLFLLYSLLSGGKKK